MAEDMDPDKAPPTTEYANAPIIFYDGAPTFMHYNGIIGITVGAMVLLPTTGSGSPKHVQKITAFLRGNIKAARSLRDSLNKAILLAEGQLGSSAKSVN